MYWIGSCIVDVWKTCWIKQIWYCIFKLKHQDLLDVKLWVRHFQQNKIWKNIYAARSLKSIMFAKLYSRRSLVGSVLVFLNVRPRFKFQVKHFLQNKIWKNISAATSLKSIMFARLSSLRSLVGNVLAY